MNTIMDSGGYSDPYSAKYAIQGAGTLFLVGQGLNGPGAGEAEISLQDMVSIYKAPTKGTTQQLLKNGFQPQNFPGDGAGPEYAYPNGRAYFGVGEAGKGVALDYASRGGYDSNIIKIDIPAPEFDHYFGKYVGSHNAVPNIEVAIPNTMFDILNQYRMTAMSGGEEMSGEGGGGGGE
jgi:hypothetical protein